MLGASVELGGGQRVQYRNQTMGGVVGEMRIGGVPLHAVRGQSAGQTAAPADLDHVAEGHGTGRLADNAGVEDFTPPVEPFEHPLGAVDRRPFLVPGDQ